MKLQTALAFACLAALGIGAAHADDKKIAIVVGGPHPYYASMEGAAADVKKQFDIGEVDYRVPQAWDVAQQNKLIESMVGSGSQAFLISPGDPVGSVTMMSELSDAGIISAVMAGCVSDPSPALFCMATDVYKSAYQGTKQLIKAMGGKGAAADHRRYRLAPAGRREDQRLSRRRGRQDRRDHHHRLDARRRRLDRASQHRRQADPHGRDRP